MRSPWLGFLREVVLWRAHQWLPSLPLCNFQASLVLTPHIVHTYLLTLKTCIWRHYLSPLWCRTSMPEDPMLGLTRTAMVLLPSAAESVSCKALSGSAAASFAWGFVVSPHALSVRSACALVSLIWASPKGRVGPVNGVSPWWHFYLPVTVSHHILKQLMERTAKWWIRTSLMVQICPQAIISTESLTK